MSAAPHAAGAKRAESHDAAHGSRRKLWTKILAVASLLLAAFLLYRTLSRYTWEELIASVEAVPSARLLASMGFAAASYLCLTGFDWMAVRYAGKPLPWRKAALASFVSLSLGHSLGFAALSSGAVRYRFYARWGLSGQQVAKVILFCGATVTLGLLLLAGVATLARPNSAATVTGLSSGAVLALGLGCLALCAIWLLCAAFARAPLRIRSWEIRFPSLRLAIGQLIIGPLNFALVAACLHQALAAFAEIDYFGVVTAYVLASAAVFLTHVPGGLGVIETVIQFLIPGAQIIGALLVFRFTYYLVPLAIGLCTFLVTELVWRSKGSRKA